MNSGSAVVYVGVRSWQRYPNSMTAWLSCKRTRQATTVELMRHETKPRQPGKLWTCRNIHIRHKRNWLVSGWLIMGRNLNDMLFLLLFQGLVFVSPFSFPLSFHHCRTFCGSVILLLFCPCTPFFCSKMSFPQFDSHCFCLTCAGYFLFCRDPCLLSGFDQFYFWSVFFIADFHMLCMFTYIHFGVSLLCEVLSFSHGLFCFSQKPSIPSLYHLVAGFSFSFLPFLSLLRSLFLLGFPSHLQNQVCFVFCSFSLCFLSMIIVLISLLGCRCHCYC